MTAAAAAEAGTRERQHEPEAGTAYTVTGLKADLRRRWDYPAEAQCRNCRAWIRCPGFGQPWDLKYPEQAR